MESFLEKKYWTVTELTGQIKGVLEPSFKQVWVLGEVSNYRPAASGHVYFLLKDQGACIAGAFFGWCTRKRAFELKDGIKILCRGKLSVYPPRGNYQLILDHIEPLGAGDLQAAFEALKEKLKQEGLFDPVFKKPLPRFPQVVVVITSASGAAIQDILTILKRRAPHIHVKVLSVLVQGDGAHLAMIHALEQANAHFLGDLIILTRGGGSAEDLWCFNHEALARAIHQSKIPVVSAVGHEIDFTIADFVSDLRAPTPSAAAEMITGNWVDAALSVKESAKRMHRFIQRDLELKQKLLSHIAARVMSPKDRLRDQVQRIDEITLKIQRAFQFLLEKKKYSFEQKKSQLGALSPLGVLERGYVLVRDLEKAGTMVKSASEVFSGQELQIVFYDGNKKVKAL